MQLWTKKGERLKAYSRIILIALLLIGPGRFVYEQAVDWYRIYNEVGAFTPYLYPADAPEELEDAIDSLVWKVKWRKAMNISLWLRRDEDGNNRRIAELKERILAFPQLSAANRASVIALADAYGICCKSVNYGATDMTAAFDAMRGLADADAFIGDTRFMQEGRYRMATALVKDVHYGSFARQELQFDSWPKTIGLYLVMGRHGGTFHMPYRVNLSVARQVISAFVSLISDISQSANLDRKTRSLDLSLAITNMYRAANGTVSGWTQKEPRCDARDFQNMLSIMGFVEQIIADKSFSEKLRGTLAKEFNEGGMIYYRRSFCKIEKGERR